jgi:hypothetical protein
MQQLLMSFVVKSTLDVARFSGYLLPVECSLGYFYDVWLLLKMHERHDIFVAVICNFLFQ